MVTYLLPRPMRSIRRPTDAIDPMTPRVGSRISLVNDFRLSTTIMSPERTGMVKIGAAGVLEVERGTPAAVRTG